MTDDNAVARRLESVLDRLERLGLIPPEPGTTAAVDPDGYPSHVVSGEIIESAWGNAVVDKLRIHHSQLGDSWAQSGTVVRSPISGSLYEIGFPEPFAAVPWAVSIMNGDASAVPNAVIGIIEMTASYVRCTVSQGGASVTGTVRFSYIAHGPKSVTATALPALERGES